MTKNKDKDKDKHKGKGKHRKPWDKLPEESSTAFEAFTNYLEMPASERSQKKMVDKHYDSSAGKLRWVEDWSSQYNWVSRAEAYEEWRQGSRIEIQMERIERAQEAISDELLMMIKEYINGAITGDITGPQVSAFKDLLDRAGLKVIEEHNHQIEVVDPSVLDSIFGKKD